MSCFYHPRESFEQINQPTKKQRTQADVQSQKEDPYLDHISKRGPHETAPRVLLPVGSKGQKVARGCLAKGNLYY